LQYPYTTAAGFTKKINGTSSYTKINGITATGIAKVNGVEA